MGARISGSSTVATGCVAAMISSRISLCNASGDIVAGGLRQRSMQKSNSFLDVTILDQKCPTGNKTSNRCFRAGSGNFCSNPGEANSLRHDRAKIGCKKASGLRAGASISTAADHPPWRSFVPGDWRGVFSIASELKEGADLLKYLFDMLPNPTGR